jgi:hypothetical protein
VPVFDDGALVGIGGCKGPPVDDAVELPHQVRTTGGKAQLNLYPPPTGPAQV